MPWVEITDRKLRESSSDSLIYLFLEIFSEKEWIQHHGNSRVSGTTAFECTAETLLVFKSF